ncbi:hypothetical protein A1O3_08729 [Capronia epimyces CBS 606.96]|uniref:Nucleoside phosphorylase domain-containing protein n=1 Tax=Capronia epimyces CBS 606.96 TaxID=1182542 RepID=W9XG54_9EURO|nr:uncharacterized protein A1O3_08729 [Capronia epimyces CBS 606.96]EXJ79228.1 hypothetical protein A1O3_08729 [Capronia epimyces CBS 606.96]
MPRSINPDEYSIVWLCPLPIKATAALFMFDETHEGLLDRQQGRTVEYHFGRIGRHNVAVAGFPSGEVGIGKAGAMAEAVIRDFKNLELGLLVGIAAAIPSATRDIRLGDVAVATPEGPYPGVVAYDMVKIVPDEALQKQWMNATHPLWRSVISKVRAAATVHGSTFQRRLKVFEKAATKTFQRPYDPPALHPALESLRRETVDPVVHYGTILSGDKVVREVGFRNQLRDKYGDPVALEMEAAGVMTSLPVAVVRGISDSADASKNDQWHAWAAAVAAAYAKEMLLQLSPKLQISTVHDMEKKEPLKGQLPKSWDFKGRKDDLKIIATLMDRERQRRFEKTVLILAGLSDAGKSQLAAAYVREQLSQDSGRGIYWINGRDRRAFEASVVQFEADRANSQLSTETMVIEDTDKRSASVVQSWIQNLNQTENTGWLMVVDDATLWNPEGGSADDPSNLGCYLDKINHGSLLVTTNRQNWLTSHENVLHLGGLDEASATSLLKSKLHTHYSRDADLHDLSRMLLGLPLSLRLAITYIRGIKVSDYVSMWRSVSWLGAAKLLILFGFLDHRNLSFDLCHNVKSANLPAWLLSLGADREQFGRVIEALLDLSFAQLNYGDNEEASYMIHPAIHAFSRTRAGDLKETFISWAIAIVADNVPRSLDKQYWKKGQALALHAGQCMVYVRATGFPPQHVERFAALYRLLGRYEEACQLYSTVLDALRPHQQAYPETMAEVLNDLGLAYYGQRKFNLAVGTFSESIQFYPQGLWALETSYADTLACIMFNYGNACRMTLNVDAAARAFHQVSDYFVERRAKAGGTLPRWGEIMFSRVLNAQGEIDIERGDTRQGMALLQRAMSIQRRHLDAEHPISLSTKLNLGRVYTDIENYNDACEILAEVTAIYREQWGGSHHATVTAADELARACMGYGQTLGEQSSGSSEQATRTFEKAESLWNDTLGFYAERYGVDSEDALRTKSNIALLQSVTGKLVMARRNMLQVFQRSKLPAQRVRAQRELASICQKMGDLDVARTNFAQAVEASKLLEDERSRTQEVSLCLEHQKQFYLKHGDDVARRSSPSLTDTVDPTNMIEQSSAAVHRESECMERASSEVTALDVFESRDGGSGSTTSPASSSPSLQLAQGDLKRKWEAAFSQSSKRE